MRRRSPRTTGSDLPAPCEADLLVPRGGNLPRLPSRVMALRTTTILRLSYTRGPEMEVLTVRPIWGSEIAVDRYGPILLRLLFRPERAFSFHSEREGNRSRGTVNHSVDRVPSSLVARARRVILETLSSYDDEAHAAEKPGEWVAEGILEPSRVPPILRLCHRWTREHGIALTSLKT